MDVLQVTFTVSNTVAPQKEKAYTIYEIEVVSSSTIRWVIHKRYSHFYALHQDLVKTISSTIGGSKIRLPDLPPKRLTRSLAHEFVEKRKAELQEYLRKLLGIPEVVYCEQMIQFLQVPDNVKPLLRHAGDSNNNDFDAKDDRRASNLKFARSYEERKILELINMLKVHHFGSTKVGSIRDFEEYYFEQRPKISPDFIKLLFQGDKTAHGLVRTCGDFEYSNVAARSALELLWRLLDVEKNKESHIYLDIFTKLDIHVLKQMQLHLHAKDQYTRGIAFQLVSILRETGAPLDVFLPDSAARNDYLQWLDREGYKSMSSYSKGSQQSFLKSLSLKDANYRAIAAEGFQQLSELQRDDTGWREVGDQDSSGIQIHYKKNVLLDVVVLRLVVAIPFDVETVAKTLINVKNQSAWDTKCLKGKVVENIDERSDVVHLVFKSFNSPYKNRDFCLLRSSQRETETDGLIISLRSITHHKIPEREHVRAILLSSGWILQPCVCSFEGEIGVSEEISSTMLTFIAQMDREGVMVYSSDLLGETDELAASYIRLSELIGNENNEKKSK